MSEGHDISIEESEGPGHKFWAHCKRCGACVGADNANTARNRMHGPCKPIRKPGR